MKDKKLICPIPWHSITILPNQRTTLCCATRDDLRKDPQETAYETFTGERMNRIRRQFLNGEWPAECGECQNAESSGQFSKRQDALRIDRFQQFLERDDLTESADRILELDLAMDRLCNLKCRMCNSEFSTKWNEDAPHLIPLKAGIVYEPSPMEKVAEIDSLIPHLQHCETIIFKGGEPMLHQRIPPFLEKLAQAGISKNIRLCFVTNLTVINRKLIEQAKNFGPVLLVVSVDGLDPLFQYIRHGNSTAQDIKRNIIEMRSEGFEVMINVALSIYNMLSFQDIVEEFKELAVRFSISYVVGDALNPQRAPKVLRDEAIRRLRAYDTSQLEPITQSSFTQLIDFLRNGAFDESSWRHFKNHTGKLDELRRESIDKVLPEIGKLMSSNQPDSEEIRFA